MKFAGRLLARVDRGNVTAEGSQLRIAGAGEAVILHSAPGTPSALLIPAERGWAVHAGNPARPVELDPDQADAEMAQAVVVNCRKNHRNRFDKNFLKRLIFWI